MCTALAVVDARGHSGRARLVVTKEASTKEVDQFRFLGL